MNEKYEVGQIELGYHITQLRERAGIKQAELANKITLSPSVLSRIEAGERALSPEELKTVLRAIGTTEAEHFSTLLERSWTVLPRPPLDHPDQDLLWSAEEIAKELNNLRARPDIRHAFECRLTEFISEIRYTAGLLLNRSHQISFIGSIGIGKTTAICRLIGLEISDEEKRQLIPVLEAGAGGTTICEVHLRTGPTYGLIIEPRNDEEIRLDVTDFAEHVLKSDGFILEDNQESNDDTQGISKEIERAIRNMARLKMRREKDLDGNTKRYDEAKDLAKKTNSIREFIVEVLARMDILRRDRRDIWYDSSTGKDSLVWLKETYEQINNGRHPDFTLPKRIEVVVPYKLLSGSELSIRIIDTKGIDRTAVRADLEEHFDDPHTLIILCSGFNNAPGAETQLLLERAKESGIRNLGLISSILVLPRPNEALACKDDSGIRAETIEEGYEFKSEEVESRLEHLGDKFTVEFFNAYQDDTDQLRRFFIERLANVRNTFRRKIEETIEDARTLLLNHEQEQVQEIVRQAAKMLQSWISQNTDVPTLNVHVQDSLLQQMAKAYASTIRATTSREGEWPNLSYSHHLGYGARRMASLSLGRAVEGFAELCKTLNNNTDYAEAQDLINQAERVLRTAYDELLRKVQLMGQTIFRDVLKLDSDFWLACNSEWRKGPGYRNRVMSHNDKWFNKVRSQELEAELRNLITREWTQTLNRVTALFEHEPKPIKNTLVANAK